MSSLLMFSLSKLSMWTEFIKFWIAYSLKFAIAKKAKPYIFGKTCVQKDQCNTSPLQQLVDCDFACFYINTMMKFSPIQGYGPQIKCKQTHLSFYNNNIIWHECINNINYCVLRVIFSFQSEKKVVDPLNWLLYPID